MPASYIRIDTVIVARNGCFGKKGLGKDLFHLHRTIMESKKEGFKDQFIIRAKKEREG
jgi:hypothetical protein